MLLYLYDWIVSILSYAIYLPIRLLSMQVCHIFVCMPPHKRIVSQQQSTKINYISRRSQMTYFFTIKWLFGYIIFTCAATTRISPRTSSGMPSNICSCSPPSPVVSDFYIIWYCFYTYLCDERFILYIYGMDVNTVIT